MFNRDGEPNVSTNHIADEMDISPGNLYYHFRNKEDIVVSLYEQLQSKLDAHRVTPAPTDAPELDRVWFYLHLIFETIGEYRFFYRDLVNILSRYRKIERPFKRMLRRELESLEAICIALGNAGTLRASRTEIAALSSNLLLLMTYWYNFATLTGRAQEPADAVYHALSLLAPYLETDSRNAILALAERYR